MEQPKQIKQENVNEIMSKLEVNQDVALNSLSNRNADLEKENAQKDAVINALVNRVIDLEQDVKNLQEELKKNAK